MRSEHEMLELILSTARNDERIRAVIMNGSRANPSVPRDIFQDFDILYLVTDVAAFTADHHWIERFGELMILQMPEAMQDPPPLNNGRFAYLMQFTDGNRIDLTLAPVTDLAACVEDSLSVALLDKDGLLPPFAPPSDRDYLPHPPTVQAFADCCNEFWWVILGVAKGLWRAELPYAKHIFERFVREQLMKMLSWYVGMATGFARSPGKFGKYLQHYLEPELWQLFEQTYADASYTASWDALFAMCVLFRTIAMRVAAEYGFMYPADDDRRVSAYLAHVRSLPSDAQQIY